MKAIITWGTLFLETILSIQQALYIKDIVYCHVLGVFHRSKIFGIFIYIPESKVHLGACICKSFSKFVEVAFHTVKLRIYCVYCVSVLC